MASLTEMIEGISKNSRDMSASCNGVFAWSEHCISFNDRICFTRVDQLTPIADKRKRIAARAMYDLEKTIALGGFEHSKLEAERRHARYVNQFTAHEFWEDYMGIRDPFQAGLEFPRELEPYPLDAPEVKTDPGIISIHDIRQRTLDASASLLCALYNLRDALERLHAAQWRNAAFPPRQIEELLPAWRARGLAITA